MKEIFANPQIELWLHGELLHTVPVLTPMTYQRIYYASTAYFQLQPEL